MAKAKRQASSKALPITGEYLVLQEKFKAVERELALDKNNMDILRRYFDAAEAMTKHRMKELKMKGKVA